MDDLISHKFEEWTKSKNLRSARITIFERIRDIPYAVIPQALDSDKEPQDTIKVGCAWYTEEDKTTQF